MPLEPKLARAIAANSDKIILKLVLALLRLSLTFSSSSETDENGIG